MLVFFVVASKAVRDPRPVHIDVALFFSVPALIIVIAACQDFGILQPNRFVDTVVTALLLAIGYVLLRVVDRVSTAPDWLVRSSEVALALLTVGVALNTTPLPGWLAILMLIYLVGLLVYSTIAFVREALQSRGVTRRRMQAAAAGSSLLVAVFMLSSLNLIAPALGDIWKMLSDTAGLAASICYFLGFAPPRWLRRAWQEPDLRAFLARAANLSRLPDLNAVLGELESGSATSLGAPQARIGLWKDDLRAIQFPLGDPNYLLQPSDEIPAAQAFRLQKPCFTDNLPRERPAYRNLSQQYQIISVLAAPITASGQRLGVLVAYGPHMQLFAEDDLELAQLLADQAASILEIRSLIEEAAQTQAREQATRLKEDFLSAAAHDLKTPLTSLIIKAQTMERASARNPGAPADRAGLQLIVREGQRLKRLVLELLDATRVEQGRLVGPVAEVDLVALAEEICARQQSELHACHVESAEPVTGIYDQIRIQQLFENIVENAIKYSPQGGSVIIKVWRTADHARIAVSDQGVGIRSEDLPHVFDRFYRGSNADDRQFAGMGLGLFICRGIVEQHGGRIWASSEPNRGTTFEIELPLIPVVEHTYA